MHLSVITLGPQMLSNLTADFLQAGSAEQCAPEDYYTSCYVVLPSAQHH